MVSRVFATKVWGWEPDRWAVLGFSQEGARNNVSRQIRPDDYILFIGTKTEHTNEEERGKLLGLARIDATHISTSDLVEPGLWTQHIKENNGSPKWPYGLAYIEAWTLAERPLAADILPRLSRLSMKLATNVEELEPEEAKRALRIAKRDVTDTLYWSPSRVAARHRSGVRGRLQAARDAPTIGPTPSTGRRIAEYRDKAAFIYVMQFRQREILDTVLGDQQIEGSDELFKIGWSYDPERRLRHFNKSFPNPASVGWELVWQQKFLNAGSAYNAEQALLKAPTHRRLRGEFILCDLVTLENEFRKAVTSEV